MDVVGKESINELFFMEKSEKKQSEERQMQKAVVIVGPTASGKSSWGLDLAKMYNGEIISADSRQTYKKMDIGTAKEIGEWQWQMSWKGWRHIYMVDNIMHHLVDIIDPGKKFTVAEFRDKAIKYIKLAHKNDRTPFVVGGTGLYVSSLVDNLHIPRIAPNKKPRDSLEEKTVEQLMQVLESLDPVAAKTIDKKNKRRIIRALEVCILSAEPFSDQRKKGGQVFNFLQIGIHTPRDVLYDRINNRVDKMIQRGLIQEIEKLLRQKYSWDLPSMSGIGYKQFYDYFNGNGTLEEAVNILKRDTRRFAKRQLSWFKRDKRIVWCQSYKEANERVKEFLEV